MTRSAVANRMWCTTGVGLVCLHSLKVKVVVLGVCRVQYRSQDTLVVEVKLQNT